MFWDFQVPQELVLEYIWETSGWAGTSCVVVWWEEGGTRWRERRETRPAGGSHLNIPGGEQRPVQQLPQKTEVRPWMFVCRPGSGPGWSRKRSKQDRRAELQWEGSWRCCNYEELVYRVTASSLIFPLPVPSPRQHPRLHYYRAEMTFNSKEGK